MPYTSEQKRVETNEYLDRVVAQGPEAAIKTLRAAFHMHQNTISRLTGNESRTIMDRDWVTEQLNGATDA